MITINEQLFDAKIVELENQIIPNKTYKDCLYGDLGYIEDEGVVPTFLKVMSDNGKRDEEIADCFEKWLKENKVKYKRYRPKYGKGNSQKLPIRNFEIDTIQFYSVLISDHTLRL